MKGHPKWFKFFFVTCIVALSLWVADVIEGTLTGIGFPIAINHASSFYLVQIIMSVFNAIYWVLNKFDCINKFIFWYEFIIGAITGFLAIAFRN